LTPKYGAHKPTTKEISLFFFLFPEISFYFNFNYKKKMTLTRKCQEIS